MSIDIVLATLGAVISVGCALIAVRHRLRFDANKKRASEGPAIRGGRGKPCVHCGRRDSIKGIISAKGIAEHTLLCHGNLDGTKANPDCYHLVTVWGESLGSRMPDA